MNIIETEDTTATSDLISPVDTVIPTETLYLNIDLGLRKECTRKNPPTYKCIAWLKQDVATETGVFIPSGFKATQYIDILLYLHGHKSGYVSQKGDDMPIHRFWDHTVLADFPFREILNTSGKSLILVAPTIGPLSQSGTLTTNDGFTDFLSKVLSDIKQYSNTYSGVQYDLSIRNIYLAAHSGGGVPLRLIAQLAGTNPYANKIKECWGFDCTYSYSDKDWYDWAKNNPDKSLYLFSIPNSSTAANAATIQKGKTPLSNIYIADSKTHHHNSVPGIYMAERLAALSSAAGSSSGESISGSFGEGAEDLDNVRFFTDLLLYKVPDDIVAYLKTRNMTVQYAHNESYSDDLNTDLYRIQIEKMPTLQGTLFTQRKLADYLRKTLLFKLMTDDGVPMFKVYDANIDRPVWDSASPTRAVMNIAIPIDAGSVVVSESGDIGWKFTTVTAPATGRHPVSGTRAFMVKRSGTDPSIYYVDIKGVDMISTGVAGLGFPIGGRIGYGKAGDLWIKFQGIIIDFINANGGKAKTQYNYSKRVEWRFVYYRYKDALEKVFGAGAGSAEKNSFFTW
jgi:hypothetical protein